MYNYYTYINSRKREAADKHSAWRKTKKTEFTKKAMILAAEAPVEWLLNSNLSAITSSLSEFKPGRGGTSSFTDGPDSSSD